MQMIYMKIFVFSVFVCILKNAFENILRCLVGRKTKQRKNPHPKSTGIHQKGTTTAKCQPPKPTPQPTASQTPHQNQPKTHSATHRNPLHKTKNQTPNQPNLINFNPPATIKPITGKTITQNRQQSNPWQIW
jgi:hypothetical protein